MAPRKEAPADVRGLEAFSQDLAASGPRPAYLLTGEDRRDLEQALQMLQAACVPPGLEAFNATRLRGLEDDADDYTLTREILGDIPGIRFELDGSDDRFPKKIRNASRAKVPFVLIAGEDDRSAGAVSFRYRDGRQDNGVPADAVPSTQEAFAQFVPLKRLGSADEVAAAVEFLAGPASSFVVGAELAVDGGLTSL